MAVHNEIGHGLREKTYERGLCIELEHTGLPYDQQASYPVFYRDTKIDDYIPDLVVENKVIVDAKVCAAITDDHRGQIINYLRITGLEVGVILNFRHAKLQWERIVLDTAR